MLLAEKQDRKPGEVSPAEGAWLMAGSLLEFLEIGGPDAVREELEELPRYQREAAVCAVRDSGFPSGSCGLGTLGRAERRRRIRFLALERFPACQR